jgi:hypothetical protein
MNIKNGFKNLTIESTSTKDISDYICSQNKNNGKLVETKSIKDTFWV